jgi:hypothetical protein
MLPDEQQMEDEERAGGGNGSSRRALFRRPSIALPRISRSGSAGRGRCAMIDPCPATPSQEMVVPQTPPQEMVVVPRDGPLH